MTEHDLALLERLRAEAGSAAVAADEPVVLADALVADGARRLPVEDVATWVAEAVALRERAEAVLAAEDVVARARAHEQARRRELLAEPAPAPAATGPDRAEPAPRHEHEEPDLDADRHAVRFSLAVLLLAQVGGVAVYLADRSVVAVALPAASMAGVLAVWALHRRPATAGGPDRSGERPEPPGTARPSVPGSQERPGGGAGRPGTRTGPVAGPGGRIDPEAVPAPPAVRAAEAHLRRQQAAWKLAWWERELPPADVGTWLRGPGGATAPATLVVVDEGDELDPALHATMTAALPAAVRLVLVSPRAG